MVVNLEKFSLSASLSQNRTTGELLTPIDAETSSPARLQARRTALEKLWLQGVSGDALLKRHTALIDAHLTTALADCPGCAEGFALVAIGGYGRRELFPFSDIDLLLLYNPAAKDKLEGMAEAIFYPLWDAGLEVGHGVRTVADCLTDAAKDFFFQVALLDARLVAGSAELFTNLQKLFRQKFIEGRRIEFLQNMEGFRSKRHQHYGVHSYLLEPNIKESRGGFRDIQAMLWTAHVVFGLQNLEALETAGLLSSQEKVSFERARNYLVRVRNQLHYTSGRKNDQLFFEYQEKIAAGLGLKPVAGLLDVEQFMRALYGHLQTLAVISDLFFEHVHESMGPKADSKGNRILEDGIELRQGSIHLTDISLPEKKPPVMMRIFAMAARHGTPVHYRTKKIIQASLHLVNDSLRQSKRTSNSFMDTLTHGQNGPLHGLEAMFETGLLTAFIPEFDKIRSLAQHDIYHVYTVDSHLMRTLVELHRLKLKEPQLFDSLSSPRILFLAGLLHDIGKGQGEDHSILGAEIAETIGRRLGLDAPELELLVFLVGHHLFLTMTAMRRDLEDEDLIMRCTVEIKDHERLAMLYLLSIADARATGPAAWSDWKGSLLLELFFKIVRLLEHKDLAPPDKRQEADQVREIVQMLLGPENTNDLGMLPDDYLASFPPETIADHINSLKHLKKKQLFVRATEKPGCYSLLVMTVDRPGLLAKICGVLALHDLDVLAAQLFTWNDGTVVDILDVHPAVAEKHELLHWEALERDLEKAINNRLGLPHRLNRKLPMATPRVRRITKGKTGAAVAIDNKTSEEYTVIEVSGEDRTGLLYRIATTLADFEVHVFRAKIARQATTVVDVFYVLDGHGCKIYDPDLQDELRQGLLFAISTTDQQHDTN